MKAAVGVVVVAWLMWLMSAGVLGERVASDAVDFHSPTGSCALPGDNSASGPAAWSWWPPGEVCRNRHGHVFRAPMPWRSIDSVVVGAGVVILPIATLMLARRNRDEADESSLGLDELAT